MSKWSHCHGNAVAVTFSRQLLHFLSKGVKRGKSGDLSSRLSLWTFKNWQSLPLSAFFLMPLPVFPHFPLCCWVHQGFYSESDSKSGNNVWLPTLGPCSWAMRLWKCLAGATLLTNKCANTYANSLLYLHAWQEEEMAFLHSENHKQEVLRAYFR